MAEDCVDNQDLIRLVLKRAGALVVIAENGRIAVEKAEREIFDVILMDMNMPEMDGYEATRLLRTRGYGRPILALTANAMSDDKDRCILAGCNDHLSKPIDKTKMMSAITQYSGKKNAMTIVEPEVVEKCKSNDIDAIESLYLDDPDIVSLLHDYIYRLGTQVNDMRIALENTQFTDLQRLAHMMKGSGGNYGYPMLTNAAKDLENAAKEKNSQTAGPALDRIVSLCNAIQKGYQENITVGENIS